MLPERKVIRAIAVKWGLPDLLEKTAKTDKMALTEQMVLMAKTELMVNKVLQANKGFRDLLV